jgi:excisionase family DNA binding protein
MPGEQLETIDELAERWRVQKRWLYDRTARTGKERIPHYKVGKYLRFKPREVDAWLERQKNGGGRDA